MAQVFLEIFSVFCGVGGPYIAPFIIPIINPALLISSFIPILLIIMYTGTNILNSTDDSNGNKTKSWGKGSGYAFLIYYVIILLISCSIMQAACKVGRSTGLV
jgi:hypothetical protein